jgi:ABC-2 type transport system permease protein
VANISKNEGQASKYANIFTMPMLFLSSTFYSLHTAPTWIKTLSRLNPFSYFVNGLHSTIVCDFWGVAANLVILLAFGVFALVAASLTFRWDSE